MRETQVWSLGWEASLEKGMATHSSILPGESHGQRSLVGYSPWGRKEFNMTEKLTHTHTYHHHLGGSSDVLVSSKQYFNTWKIGVSSLNKNHGNDNEAGLKQQHVLGREDNDFEWENVSASNSDKKGLRKIAICFRNFLWLVSYIKIYPGIIYNKIFVKIILKEFFQ